MTLSLKNFDRMCLGIVVIVSVSCGYLTVNHVTKQQRQIRQENALLSKRLRDLDLADTNLNHLKTVLNATRRELATLNEQIPETAKMGEFLKGVDALMKQREAVMINLQPLPIVKEKLYTRNPIRLIFKGPFAMIYRVLCDLETMNRTVVMEKMTIAKSNIPQECRVDLLASIFERS
jgi:Tfp pilus assembly protein PilO